MMMRRLTTAAAARLAIRFEGRSCAKNHMHLDLGHAP